MHLTSIFRYPAASTDPKGKKPLKQSSRPPNLPPTSKLQHPYHCNPTTQATASTAAFLQLHPSSIEAIASRPNRNHESKPVIQLLQGTSKRLLLAGATGTSKRPLYIVVRYIPYSHTGSDASVFPWVFESPESTQSTAHTTLACPDVLFDDLPYKLGHQYLSASARSSQPPSHTY